MSDGISRIELKAAGAYSRYSDEAEERGLLRTAPDCDAEAAEAAEAARRGDDKDLLPVMIENGLEKIGVL